MTVQAQPHGTQLPVVRAASLTADAVLDAVGSLPGGLTEAEAAHRLALGANVREARRVSWPHVLVRQFASPLQGLLVAAAIMSFATGDQLNATIILAILSGSAVFGFVNEYRAERTAADLHRRISHTVVVVREGVEQALPVRDLVPGDVIRIGLGNIVPADARLLEAAGLETDEALLTGESAAVEKSIEPVPERADLADLSDCLLMGTVVHAGSARDVVTATGRETEFGLTAELAQSLPKTAFQRGLKEFSLMLLWVGLGLTAGILVINLLLARPPLDSILFSLAIAVGITPQRLPAVVSTPQLLRAVVSTSLVADSRLLAKEGLLVKRLLAIEDLGNLDVLVMDKTGTLTEGTIGFEEAVPAASGADGVGRLTELALLCCEVDPSEPGASGAGQNPVDAALWEAFPELPALLEKRRRLDLRPFDHDTRTMETAVSWPDPGSGNTGGSVHILKGAPEAVMERCAGVSADARARLEELFRRGARVIAVASRPGRHDGGALSLEGFLSFIDQPKADARESLDRLAELGVDVKVATGDNALVAEHVISVLGMSTGTVLTGTQVAAMDDDELAVAAKGARVFARVSPKQKARIVTVLRRSHALGFLGDGSTMRLRSTMRMSGYRWTVPRTSQRTPPTSFSWRRTSASSPTGWWAADASSPTRSSTCSWGPAAISATCSPQRLQARSSPSFRCSLGRSF